MPKNPDQTDTLDERFAANMRRLRVRQNLSQGELALQLQKAGLENFHQTTVSRIENGDRALRIGEAGIVARSLGSTLDAMLTPPTEESLLEALKDATEAIASTYEEIYQASLRLLRALHAGNVLLVEAVRRGQGPMDPQDVMVSRPEFQLAWSQGRTVEGHAEMLRLALADEPERAVAIARAAFENQETVDGVDPEA